MEPKLKKELQKILTALAIFFAMMVVDKTGLCPLIFAHRLPSLIAYLIPYLLCGYDVVRKALLGIKNRQPMDEALLMFVATIGAFATGENSEAVAVMAFYLVGEWFQKYALGKSRKNIASLMDIVPEEANVERADGSIETVDPDDVEIGDILVIRPGEKIPVDAEVLSGESMVNTAALTGESVPRSVHPGEAVISGCINGEGLLRVRATKAFEDSTVSKILELVENASEKKSKTENFITRFARVYTPIVVYSAIALAIIPSILTRDPATWIYRACTFLVVSCPCALVISVPLAFFGGIGAASSNGVLVKGSNYLELLSHLHTVVSDKTGTLTEGNFQVSEVLPAAGVEKTELLHMAALAEGMSTHPIAKSIRDAYTAEAANTEINTSLVTDTVNVSGQGLIATLPGHRIFVGNAKLMQAYGIDFTEETNAAATVSYVAVEENSSLPADTSSAAGQPAGSDGAAVGICEAAVCLFRGIPVPEVQGAERRAHHFRGGGTACDHPGAFPGSGNGADLFCGVHVHALCGNKEQTADGGGTAGRRRGFRGGISSVFPLYPPNWTNPDAWPFGALGVTLFLLELTAVCGIVFILRAGKRLQEL